MSVDSVSKYGRVEYIEPNNLFVNSVDRKVQNGIPQPYEDYTFSVNLRVINGDRYACGMTDDSGDISGDFLEYSSDKGTISFMEGSTANGQSYLTTNFTDINMNDPSSNTKECLGIESINIKYDSWFYPTVDIKFVDVRGASLMLPAEYEYYNNGNPNPVTGNNRAVTNSDFFKAFFSFPYPLFKLSVKGFYGKEVTYDLSVLKCNVEFNSSTGNFEINASFIGYMYGLYGDFPFPFAYIAPYISLYGKNTWNEKKNSKDFWYIDSNNEPEREMYTFPQLRGAVKNAGEQAESELGNSDSGICRTELEKLINEINSKIIFKYPMTMDGSSWWYWTKTDTDAKREGYFYIPISNTKETDRTIFENFYTFSKNLSEYNELAAQTEFNKDKKIQTKNFFNDFKKDADAVLNRPGRVGNSTGTTVSSPFSDEEIADILNKSMVVLSFHKDTKDKDNPVLVFDESNSIFSNGNSKTELSKFTDLIEELKKRFTEEDVRSPMQKNMAQDKWLIRAFKFENLDYKSDIVGISDDLKRELDTLTVNLDNERELSVIKAIGFDPTIKNMFNMVFAHIDTFMSCFYNTLDRIRKSIQSSDDSRKYTNLCADGRIEVDVNENTLKSESSNGGKLPPFTMFYKEETVKDSEDKKVVMMWPGELNGGDQLDEVKLVEAIINATSLCERDFEFVTQKNNILKAEGKLVPTNYYDIVCEDRNPYLDVLNEKSLQDDNVVDMVLKVFLFRCFYAMLNGSFVATNAGGKDNSDTSNTSNFTEKAKLIARLEAGNVKRAFLALNMNPTEAFLRGLLKQANEGSELLKKYIGTNKPILNESNGGLVYNWIAKYNVDKTFLYNCLPVGVFSPSTLENYANGANLKADADKFLKVSKSGTTVNGSYACHLYGGGKKLEKVLQKYSSGDFSDAARLFPNYGTLPKSISGLSFTDGTFGKHQSGIKSEFALLDVLYKGNFDGYIIIPSYRKTSDGDTNIFMDPLYYAQESIEARAYMFLMGVPYGKDKKYFIPDTVENGDYPTLLLLREGAYYWRKERIRASIPGDILNDPITYTYKKNGVLINTIDDIEKNDPCFGRKVVMEAYKDSPNKSSAGRENVLIRYFLKWATGNEVDDAASVTAESYTHVEIPSPSVSFSRIEQNLALCERKGNTSQVLSPESCSLAVTAKIVDAFSNSVSLRMFYNAGQDGSLGILKGNIRTDVMMKEKLSDGQILPYEFLDFYHEFYKLYVGFDTIIDFSCLDNPSSTFSVNKDSVTMALSKFVEYLKRDNNASNQQIKENNGVNSSISVETTRKREEYFRGKDFKLACYIALKSLYDRWICNRRRERWTFSCIPERMDHKPFKSDFLRFYYIDEFYHNVGTKVRPDLTNFVENACKLGGFTEKTDEANLASSSVIKVLSTTAQYGRCSLLTLPTALGLAKSYDAEKNTISDVFKAFPYNESVKTDTIETSFIVLSTSQKSAVLAISDDKGKMGYRSDGFDIANTWGEIIEQPFFSDAQEDGFTVPCFGVTFAKQNQSYFKDVRLSMEDHQVTDFSIKNEVMISYQSNRGPRETAIVGQNLYNVYSNYSYSCSVTMLGDAQISPLMYFQLNNIPMWKGAYLITNVQHSITSRGMETVFSGVRQARPALPYKDEEMQLPANSASHTTPPSQEETHPAQEVGDRLDMSQRELDKIKIEDVRSIVFILDRTSLRMSDKWVNGLLSVRVFYNDGTNKTFYDIGKTIEATYGLVENMGKTQGRIENFVPPEDMGVVFCIPAGRYSSVKVENPISGEEYRDKNDTFYQFTSGKHIIVRDDRLKTKYCEIITGETSYDKFENGGFEEISLGGTSPILLYPGVDEKDMNNELDRNEIRAAYKEIFNLIRRANEAKKVVTFLINENEEIQDTKVKEKK